MVSSNKNWVILYIVDFGHFFWIFAGFLIVCRKEEYEEELSKIGRYLSFLKKPVVFVADFQKLMEQEMVDYGPLDHMQYTS